jgi:hypothetical protein
MEYMLGSFPACFPFVPSILVLMAYGAIPSQAQSAAIPVEMPTSERSLVAGSFANERLWVWQKRLNLEDWNISVVVSRASDLKPKTVGNIKWDRDKKTAVIRVLDPADYHMALEPMLRDIEFTVVHELIHLEMSPVLSDLQRTEANRREEEFAVNHMADALLKLERGQ